MKTGKKETQSISKLKHSQENVPTHNLRILVPQKACERCTLINRSQGQNEINFSIIKDSHIYQIMKQKYRSTQKQVEKTLQSKSQNSVTKAKSKGKQAPQLRKKIKIQSLNN